MGVGGAGATVLAPGVMNSKCVEGDQGYSVVLTSRVMDSLGMGGCYFVSFSLVSGGGG